MYIILTHTHTQRTRSLYIYIYSEKVRVYTQTCVCVCVRRVPGTHIYICTRGRDGCCRRRASSSLSLTRSLARSLTVGAVSLGRRKVVYPGNSVGGGSRGEAKSAALPPGPGSHGNALRICIYIIYIYIMCTSVIFCMLYIYIYRYTTAAAAAADCNVYNTPPPPPPPPLFVGRAVRYPSHTPGKTRRADVSPLSRITIYTYCVYKYTHYTYIYILHIAAVRICIYIRARANIYIQRDF